MSVLFLDVLFAVFVASAGVGVGWWIRGSFFGRQEPSPPAPQPVEAQPDLSDEVLQRLQQMAVSMAADVDQHSSRVQEISDELKASDSRDSESVVAAVEKIIKANSKLQQQLESAEDRLHEQARQIESHAAEARTDALTGLANRRAFDDELKAAESEFQQHGRPVSMMLIDVDHFKKFNDTYGHQAGDEVLRGVARVLRRSLSKTALVARYGGEEFAVVFRGASILDIQTAAERARSAIAAETFEFDDLELKVAASAGLAELLRDEDLDTLVRRADDALYASKEAGRDCGHWHDGENFHPLSSATAGCVDDSDEVSLNETQAESSAAEQRAGEAQPTLELPALLDANELGLDSLTGLSNRSAFLDDMNRRVAEWKRGGAPASAMLARVDGFAELASNEGREQSQVVLRAVAQFFKAAMREMDHVARFDDETFAMLLPAARMADTARIAERLRGAIARCNLSIENRRIRFTISVGIAETFQGDTAQLLVERSELALAAAVQDGGNCTFGHDGTVCCRPESVEAVAAN